MTALFGALRETQARGRQSLGALGRELSAAVPGGRPAQPPALAADPEVAEDEPPAQDYQAPVRLPGGMYVSDHPDPNRAASLPSYHPSLTGSMANAAGADPDERAVMRAGGDLSRIFQ